LLTIGPKSLVRRRSDCGPRARCASATPAGTATTSSVVSSNGAAGLLLLDADEEEEEELPFATFFFFVVVVAFLAAPWCSEPSAMAAT